MLIYLIENRPFHWSSKLTTENNTITQKIQNFNSFIERSNWYNVCVQSPSLSPTCLPACHHQPLLLVVSKRQVAVVGLSRVILILLAKSHSVIQPTLSYIVCFIILSYQYCPRLRNLFCRFLNQT